MFIIPLYGKHMSMGEVIIKSPPSVLCQKLLPPTALQDHSDHQKRYDSCHKVGHVKGRRYNLMDTEDHMQY